MARSHNPPLIFWPIWWAVAKMDQLTCLPILLIFLLQRSGFDSSLALQFIERGVVQLPFALQEQIGAVSSLFKRSYVNKACGTGVEAELVQDLAQHRRAGMAHPFAWLHPPAN